MNMNANKKLWLGAALGVLALLGVKASAAGVGSPSYLNIDVTISASKSVSIVGLNVSSQSTTWTGQATLAAASTAAVRNDSGVLSEGWQLSTTANSIDATTGGAGWTIASSSSNLAADNVAVQAVFGSSNTVLAGCPAAGAADWNSGTVAPPLTTTLQTYGPTLFADATLNNNGQFVPDTASTMFAYNATTGAGQRALCWRLAMPSSTSLNPAHVQIVPVIVTAL
jgi:hypothetical protein